MTGDRHTFAHGSTLEHARKAAHDAISSWQSRIQYDSCSVLPCKAALECKRRALAIQVQRFDHRLALLVREVVNLGHIPPVAT